MNELKDFLIEQYGAELGAFRAALESVPAEHFNTAAVGHTPAWHALHVAEWLRFFALQDFSATYAHLGWEQAPWMPALRGTPPVTEDAGKPAVLAELNRISTLIVAHLREMREDQFSDVLRSPAAPTGERTRLTGLGMHLRHIAYHRGQVGLGKKVLPQPYQLPVVL